MPAPSVQAHQIIKIKDTHTEEQVDLLSVEEPLEIRLNFGAIQNREQRSISVTMRTPGHDFELALGFLYAEGIIESYREVKHVSYCLQEKDRIGAENVVKVELQPGKEPAIAKLTRHFYTTSSCGVCGKASIEAVSVSCPVAIHTSLPVVDVELIHALPAKLRQAQSVFTYTGGLHAAGLFNTQGALKLLREDVGRHNAVDKIIGASLVNNALPLQEMILMVSGRTSFELVQKAAMAGIPILAAVGAPSSLAVQLAESSGITLLGFVRNNIFNVYTHPARIKPTK